VAAHQGAAVWRQKAAAKTRTYIARGSGAEGGEGVKRRKLAYLVVTGNKGMLQRRSEAG